MHPDYGYFEESQLGKPYDVKLLKRLYPYIRPYKLMILWSIQMSQKPYIYIPLGLQKNCQESFCFPAIKEIHLTMENYQLYANK